MRKKKLKCNFRSSEFGGTSIKISVTLWAAKDGLQQASPPVQINPEHNFNRVKYNSAFTSKHLQALYYIMNNQI